MAHTNAADTTGLFSLRPDDTSSNHALAALIAADSRPVGDVADGTCAVTAPDPVFAQIEAHRALHSLAWGRSYPDDDPMGEAAREQEDQALEALADTVPTSVAGVAAFLRHMLEHEGFDATTGGPLIRSIHSAAKALAAI